MSEQGLKRPKPVYFALNQVHHYMDDTEPKLFPNAYGKFYSESFVEQLEQKCHVFWENRKALEKELSRISKSYNFDQARIEQVEKEKAILLEALELIKDKAPWCECMDAPGIAKEALSKLGGG